MHRDRTVTIIRSEISYLVAQPVFWILLVVLGALTFSLSPAVFIPSESGTEGQSVWINSRYALLQFFAFSGLLGYTVLGSLLAGISVIRDMDSGIAPIMNSTPLRPSEYIIGKMAGVSVVLCLALLWHIAITIVSYEWISGVERDLGKGPFNLGHYVSMGFLGAFPGLWIGAASTFFATLWIRRSLVVYAVPAMLLVMTLSTALVTPNDASWSLPAMLLDSSGIRWMFHTIFATDQGIAEYNTAPIAFDGIYIANRIIMVGVGLLAVVLSIPAARLWMRESNASWLMKLAHSRLWPRKKRLAQTRPPEQVVESVPAMSVSRVSRWREVLYIAGMEMKEAFKQPVYFLVVLVVIGLVLEAANESGAGILGTSMFLTAGSISVAAFPMLGGLLCMLMLMFVAESSHRDKRTRLAEIIHASPVRSFSIVAGRFLAGIGFVICVLAIVVVLCVFQLSAQGAEFMALKPFFVVWGGLLLPTLVLWSAGTLLIAGLSKNWATTYTVSLLLLGFSIYATGRGWVDWSSNWLLWGALRWSDMGAFVQDADALLLNRSWVLALSALLLFIAVMRYHRTDPDQKKIKALFASRADVLKGVGLVLIGIVVLALIGFTRWNVHNGFQGERAKQQAKAYWQENMRTWLNYQAPDLVFMDVDVVLDPVAGHMDVTGSYTLVNGTDYPIHVVPFTMPPAFEKIGWRVDTAKVEEENRAGLHLVPLDASLAIGDTVKVGFSYEAYIPNGMSRNGGALSHFILPSGVLLSTARGDFLPLLGYDEGRGISSENSYEVADKDPRFIHLNHQGEEEGRLPYLSRIQVTVPVQYTITATGTEVSRSEANGMHTVLWETQYPVTAVNVMAGKWSEKKQGSNAIYYHPAHDQNIDTLMDALVSARDRYSEWFSPYPWGSLRINEFPNVATTATAYPTNISFSEGMGFLTRPETEGYQAYVIAAHEVAHQWWGHFVSPSEEPGSDVLTEAMANYATIRLLQVEKGPEARDSFLEWLEERYMAERRIDRERPLSKSTLGSSDAETVVYHKGALVLWQMHLYLGANRMDTAMQAFIGRYALHTGRRPGLDDFLAVVREHAEDPIGFDVFISKWIESTGWEPLYCADC
ncbi:MAG: hypothetical protein KTR29_18220 [Rhodothermaceae bacterium]|nr:hypothetical protein [Rhodothermaceae bacterium]